MGLRGVQELEHYRYMVRRIGIFLLLAISAFSFAGQDEHSQAFWEKKYKDIGNMFWKMDLNGYTSLFAPGYKLVDENGKTYSRTQTINALKVSFKEVNKAYGSMTATKVKPTKNGMNVDFQYKYRLSLKTPPGENNKWSIGRETGTETWKKMGGDWKLVKSVIHTSVYQTYEVGHPVRHGPTGGG